MKVGNSYYNSRELGKDLCDHGQIQKYQAISRFGIGFLSCFLCGNDIEVSTLYFNPAKNKWEEHENSLSMLKNYGLFLQITGLTGYYTLKSQAEGHLADNQLPIPDSCIGMVQNKLEMSGYLAEPGTSIVIRLEPGKWGI